MQVANVLLPRLLVFLYPINLCDLKLLLVLNVTQPVCDLTVLVTLMREKLYAESKNLA